MGDPENAARGPAIVVPVYNDWSSLEQLARAIAGLAGPRPWLIVVDDGSSEPGPDLDALAALGLTGEILRLRRNLGHQQAIAVHESPRATKLYDRPGEDITLDAIERITI